MTEHELLKSCLFLDDKIPVDSGVGEPYNESYCQDFYDNYTRQTVIKELAIIKGTAIVNPRKTHKARQVTTAS